LKQNFKQSLDKVSDTGVGMTEEIIDRIFRIGSSVSQNGTSEESGSGPGLILSKEFVQKLGGEISAQSRPGKGTKFVVSFQLKL
jgi:signal transduction histidine kinase